MARGGRVGGRESTHRIPRTSLGKTPAVTGFGCTIHTDSSNKKGMDWQMSAKISPLGLEHNSEASDSICQAE